MFTHYLSIALRNFRRAPFTAFINIFTLALGLVVFVVARSQRQSGHCVAV